MAILHITPSVSTPQDDPLERMALDDREDWALLRLVVCVAIATVAMAIASTLQM
jgi:hypothetical protein